MIHSRIQFASIADLLYFPIIFLSVFFFLLPFAQTTNFTNGSGVFLWFLMLHCDYYWLYFLLTWNNVLQVSLHLPLSFWPIRNELLSLWSIPPNSHHVNLPKIWGLRSVKYIHTWLNLSSLASFFWSLLYTNWTWKLEN